jgi:putative membrane protein
MGNMYWADWYSGWGWFLWFGVMILLFSSLGNWGYTYRVHQFSGRPQRKEALDILSERYARGEITHADFAQMKSAILSEAKAA